MDIYKNAMLAIRDRRRADVDRGHMIWQNALTADDGLYSAFTAWQSEAIKSAKHGDTPELARAQAELIRHMERLGLTKDKVEPPCRCAVCADTGIVGGKYCRCVINAAVMSDTENLEIPVLDFEAKKLSAPKAISGVYSAAKKYIDGYPNSDKPFFTVIGDSGTGKTVLASAVASAFMQCGASVVAVTAFGFVRRALDYHTQFSIKNYTDRFTPMLDCDLLIIDDLGTESMLKNVTKEYLYTVINERWLHRKNTLITSNLSPADFIARYGENIASRLFDKNTAVNCMVTAKNNRLKN